MNWPLQNALTSVFKRLGPAYLPFADAASASLPLIQLFRLALFQFSVGMVTALLVGTLNRVMILELGVSAWLVSLMVALPLVASPFRALIGFRSDIHRSILGWRRVPFIWFGTLLQFGGLAILPFALVLLTGNASIQLWLGHIAAVIAFIMIGTGFQTTQTAGLALATDLTTAENRPRVVALMYVFLLLGLVTCSGLYGVALEQYSHTRLIQVIQGTAVCVMILNIVALWKQEPRNASRTTQPQSRLQFQVIWKKFQASNRVVRFLVALGLGTAAFNMQDIILEPYGGQILNLSVSGTAVLTGLMALGSLIAFWLSAIYLKRQIDPHRLAAIGLLVGLAAFSAVVFAEPLRSAHLFRAGVFLIGFGGGLFSVATLIIAMSLETHGFNGLALGAWGAVQASCAGLAIFLGGAIRDLVSTLAMQGLLGSALINPATGYSFVYHIEIYLIFAALIALGPLAAGTNRREAYPSSKFGLAEFPG
jgi:MFS transporter, BCD family, chlorophyll transporter